MKSGPITLAISTSISYSYQDIDNNIRVLIKDKRFLVGHGRFLGGRVGYELKRAQHALRSEMDGALRGVGLTTPQYAALSVLEGEEGISGALLARRCFVTPQTMNGILVNLEDWKSTRLNSSPA